MFISYSVLELYRGPKDAEEPNGDPARHAVSSISDLNILTKEDLRFKHEFSAALQPI